MAEWMTHVLFAFALFTIASWYSGWIGKQWVAVAMIGSILPDLSRFKLLASNEIVSYLVGSQFAWSGIHTLAGVVLLSGIGAVMFETSENHRRAFGMLLAGALVHFVVDLPQRYADGRMIANSYTFPIPTPRPPTPGWYVSADRWVVVVAVLTALVVFAVDYRRSERVSEDMQENAVSDQ